MSDFPTSHSADASAVGYYHQGLYALVVLLDSGDSASVSIETADDVVRHDTITSLHQLKHSLGTPPSLTVKNDGLWNTIGFWGDGPFDGSLEFVFVTCASISLGSELETLKNKDSDRKALLLALEDEANRVTDERKAAKDSGKQLPYADRGSSCSKFLHLSATDRRRLVELMQITPDSFTAADVPAQVENRLRNCVDPNSRAHVVERLIEWWDRQVVLSILGKRARRLSKLELQLRVHELLVEHSAKSLPNLFQDSEPESISDEIGTIMEQQIHWVKGGRTRIKRAAIARWRARNQRAQWIDGDFAAASELDLFDMRLLKAWSDRFHPMQEDCENLGEEECCRQGLQLLEWSHFDAHDAVPQLREQAPHSYIVQGSLQQLAEQGNVGWHPSYDQKLALHKAEKGA
jgi:hypothetical protein